MVIAAKDVNKNVSPLRSTHSVVAIVDIGTAKKSLLVPIEITAERKVNGARMDVNTISSVYEKSVKSLVTEAIAQENAGDIGIFYAKKEAMTLPGAGVQFPVQLQQSIASNGIIHRFSEKVNMNISEMVCDAMGEMNVFATEGTSTVAGEVGQFLRDLRKTAKNEALNSNNAVQDASNETPTSDNGIRDSNNEAQAEGQKNNAPEGVKFSRELTTDGRVVAVVDEDILSNLDLSNWNQETKEAAQKAAAAALLKFQDGIAVEGITRKVNRISRKEFTRSEYTNELFWWNSTAFLDKMRAANNLDDVVIATTDWARDGKLKHPRTDNFVDFDHGTTLIASGDAKYEAEVVVGITDKGDAVFYDIVNMKQGDFSIKKEESSPTATTNKSPGSIFEDSSKKNVAQQSENVKQKYSRELDSEYMELAKDPEGNSTELTVEQMAYDVMARAAGLNRQKATKADQAVERATEELNRLLKAGRTRERARIEQNQQTTYRQQIKNVSEKFQRMLLRPGKGATQHAPANLVGAVRSFCELFNDSEMRRAARWQLTLDTFFNYVCGCI